MFVVLEAMADAGVLAGLPRGAAQDMAVYTMLVRMMSRNANMLISKVLCSMEDHAVCDCCSAHLLISYNSRAGSPYYVSLRVQPLSLVTQRSILLR